MRVPVPYPVEYPAYSLAEPARGARRPLIVVGERSIPTPHGWTREERAVFDDGHYLGEQLQLDPSSDASLDALLRTIILGRVHGVFVKVEGVVVPTWSKLDDLTKDLLLAANRLWPVPSDGRVALIESSTPAFARPLYRLDGTTSARLVEVERATGKYVQTGLVERLEACAPSWVAFEAETAMTVMRVPDRVRDFEAAKAAAQRFRDEGRPGAWIARYLATYGYQNSKGVPGAWHHARLTELTGRA